MLEKPGPVGFNQVDAALHTFSLVELAEIISALWRLPKPRYQLNPSLSSDRYQADHRRFLELLEQYAIREPDLNDQLRETAELLCFA